MSSPHSRVRSEFRDLLPAPAPKAPASPGPSAPLLRASSSSPAFSAPNLSTLRARSLPPGLIAVIHAIAKDLEARSTCLLGLNPSRREAISHHLNRLATGAGRANLAAWLQPQRNAGESQALLSYFEEVAIMTIGQAILLKRWADRGLRPFRSEHLGKLNFELSTALRAHVPLHREGFHLTRPNLYSWYALPANLQEELARTLEGIDFREESPAFLLEICTDGRRFSPEWPELLGYDSRFYQEAAGELVRWSVAARTSPSARKTAFTPTLRLGQIAHMNADAVQWIGCEENTFSLLIAEMIDLWWGPKAPPVWANTSSLDVHPKEQLSLVAPGLKPGVLSMLSDMEACDFGWIAEERSQKATKWKAQLDSLPFFKRLRGAGTHLGTLQACVAVTKIRPGGRLLWIREEPLTAEEGSEALSFILARAKLAAEIDLSHVEHSLPTRRPLFPRYVYVLERELRNEERSAWRPIRWLGQGAIRSHVEIPLFLSDLLAAARGAEGVVASLPQRANWKLTGQASPLPQKEWMARWPDPSCARSLSAIEEMSRDTLPLANLATIRPLTKAVFRAPTTTAVPGSDKASGRWLSPDQPALFVEAKGEAQSRRLSAVPFRDLAPGLEHTGFAILLRDETWVDPIRAYLESTAVSNWVEHHAERRGDRWVLSEGVLKMVPIPERLTRAIQLDGAKAELRDLAGSLARAPESAESLSSLPPETRFVACSYAIRELEAQLAKIRPMLAIGETGEARIEWSMLLGLLRAGDSLPLTQHPFVRIVGNLSPNVPLTRVDRLKAPQNGLLLMTESGSLQKVVFDHRLLAEMAWDQAKFHSHPTWGEIVATVRLPRSLEIAESAANEILRSHEELRRKIEQLRGRIASGVARE